MSQKRTGSSLLVARTGAVLAILFCCTLLNVSGFAQQGPAAPQMKAQIAQLPLAFEPNQGQADRQVKFLARGPGYLLLLTRDEAVLSLGGSKTNERDIVRLKLSGANRNAKTEGLDILGGKTNYFLGNDPRKWRTNISNYSKVRYEQVYPGVDLLYYGKQSSLEHDFIVAPNADPGKIALEVKGAKQLRLDAQGNLLLTTAHGQVQLDKPYIFQTDKNGNRVEIAGGFALQGNRVGFKLGAYDKSRELVIDPVLNYATYFGGDATTTATAIAIDTNGNAYVTGNTTSTTLVASPACVTCTATPNNNEIYVLKLNASGTAATFLAIIGGSGNDTANAITIDGAGTPNVYVTGETTSTNFPTTAGAFLTTAGNSPPDAYVVKLAGAGSSLTYSTYLNGGAVASDGADGGRGIAVDASATPLILVTGYTASTTFLPASFVVGPQLTNGGGRDAFLVKLNPAGGGAADLYFGTYWGGTLDDEANAIAFSSGSRSFVAGMTKSANFPVNGTPAFGTRAGNQDGFVVNFRAGGGTLTSINCTDSPNNSITVITTIPHGLLVADAFDVADVGDNSQGLVFNATGESVATVVDANTFTYTSNSGCNNNVGLGVITAGLSRIVGRRRYSTYLGGDVDDSALAIAVDGNLNAYIAGSTNSTATFPNGANAIQNTGLGGGTDAFIAKLPAAGNTVTYSAYLGGAGNEVGTSVAVNKLCTGSCEAYIAGTTTTGAGFFNTNALQGAFGGVQDGFVARVAGAGTSLLYRTYFGGTGTDSIDGIVATYSTNSTGTNTLYLAGSTSGSIGASSSFGATATTTSSALQSAPGAGATGSALVAKLQASNVANPVLTISGAQSPAGPVGQATTPVPFASAVTYNWVVSNTNLARAVTVDIPIPQSANVDLLSIGTPGISGSGSAFSTCTKTPGTSAAPGGVTCLLQTNATGDFAAGSSTTIALPATLTAQAHCDNAPCTDIAQVGKVASAETSSLATSTTVTSTVVPVVNLDITGSVTTDVGADAVFQQGIDNTATYTITVTNNSGTTTAAVDPSLDVLLTANYPANFVVTSTTPALTGGALVVGTPACKDNSGTKVLECTIDTIPAAPGPGNTAQVTIVGNFTSAASNPALPTLLTTSKFPAGNTTQLFTSTGNNANVAVNIGYQALSSDVQVTGVTDNTDPIQAGQTLTYTIGFRNNGPTDATNAVVTTAVDFAFDAQTKPGFCTQSAPGANIVCNVGAIATMVGADPDLTIVIGGPAPLSTSASSLTGTVTSTIAADQFDGVANNTANQTTVIERRATLSITTATSTGPVAVGGGVTFNVTVHNDIASPSTASNVVATITLPAGFTSLASGTAGCNIVGQVVTCTAATLAPNADYAIAITANAPTSTTSASQIFATSVSVNSAGTLDPTGLPHNANINTTVTRTSDLVLTTATDNSPVRTSGPLTFTTLVTNSGPDPANNVQVAFTMPNANYTLSGNTFSGGCLQAGAAITCSLTGDLANAGTSNNTMSVTPDPAVPGGTASQVVNTGVQVFSTTVTDDGTAGAPGADNSQTVNSTIQREVDLALTGFGGEGFTATPTVSSQGQITYTLAVRNNIGFDTATGVTVKFLLTGAGGFGFVGSTGTTGCTITGALSDELTCTLANLAAGSQTTITATITPPVGFITAGNSATLNANATVSGTAVDNTPGNNTRGPVSTTVERQADLALSGFVGASFTGTTPVGLSSNVTFTLVTKNNGPDDATGVTVTYTLPLGFTYVSDTLGNTCTPAATTVSCPVGALANGATTSFNLVITPPAGLVSAAEASDVFNASVAVSSANVIDGTAGNDGNGPIVITVERQSNFDVSGFSATATTSAAGMVTYGVTITNNGPDDAAAVKVAFTLTAGNSFVGTTAANGCVVTSPTVRTCDIGTVLANGASPVTFNLQITPSPTAVPVNSPSAVISGQVTSVASATSVDKVGGAKTSSVGNTTVERRTDLSLSAFTATPTVNQTGDLVYGLTVDNTAGLDTATNVKVTFTITSGFTFQSTTASGGCTITSATTLDCTVGSVTTGAPVPFTATVRAPAGFVPAGSQSAVMSGQPTAVFSASVVDGVTGTKSLAALNTTVERQSDLSLNGFGGEGFTATTAVSTAGNITYSLAVRNNGPDNATNVTVTFDFNAPAAGFAFVSTSLGGGCVISTPTQLTCTIGNLANAAQTTFTAVITPPAGFIASGNSANLTANATVLSSSLVDGTANDTRGPVSTAVQRQADLRASGGGTSFTGPALPINSSATATYTISVVNGGPDADDNVVLAFNFTNPVTALNSASPALGVCVLSTTTTVTCTMPAGFASGTTRSGSINISPDSATLLAATNSAPYDVSATISSSTAFDNGVAGAPGANNTTGTVTTTVQRQADLQLVSMTGPAAVADGGALTYTIVVRNNGPDTAGSVRVVDPLPIVTNGGYTLNAGGATFVAPAGAGVCSANQLTPQSTIVCMLGAMASGQTATITVSGVANIDPNTPSDVFTNVATVDASVDAVGTSQTALETNGGNNSNSTFSTTVSRSANLEMLVVNSTPVLVGGALDPGGAGTAYVVGTHQSIQYDITAGNNAASPTTVTNAFVQTTLPTTLTFSSSVSGCGAVGQVVTCNIGTVLTPGATASVTFIAVPGATLPVSPSSNVNVQISPSISAPGNTDPDPSNNSLNNITTVNRVSDLSISQTAPALPVSVTVPNVSTATYNYTWQVTNNGPSNATGVVVSNVLPTDLTFVSGSWPTIPGTTGSTCSAAGQNVTCNVSTINSGSTVTITVAVRPNLNTALANKSVQNQPSVSGSVQDNVSANNNDVDSVELRGVTDLQVTITPVQDPAASAGQVLVGNSQTWAVTVTNNGPYPAGSVITLTNAVDPSDPAVNIQSATGTGSFNCLSTTTCTLGSLGVSQSQTVNVVTTTPAAAVTGQTTPLSISGIVTQYSNGANLAGDVTDSNAVNNTGNGSVTGRAAADVVVAQTAPATVVVGQSGNKFAVTVSNVNGRSAATNVVLTNTVAVDAPTSVSTTAFGTPSQGSCNAATGLGTATITITCNLGTIATGASATVDLAMTPTLGGSLKNTPTVTPTAGVGLSEVDPVASNNTPAQASITVNTTPPGQQTFPPTDPVTGAQIPSVLISGFILIPGNTTMVVDTSNVNSLALPANYRFGNAGAATNFYTISNTASFNNNGITVCVSTPETFFQPHRARLFRLNPATDITTSSGFVQTGAASTHQVCGTVPTLPSGGSTFVAMESINTVPTVNNATVTITGTGSKGAAGTSVTLDASGVIDTDSFACMKLLQNPTDGTVALPPQMQSPVVPTNCADQSLLIYRWVGNFTDVSEIDQATGLKVIKKDCRQTTPFFDGQPCNKVLTSVSLGASTVRLTVTDENFLLNPPNTAAACTLANGCRDFQVGVSGSSSGPQTQTVNPGQSGTFTFNYTYFANTTFTFTGSPSLASNSIVCSAQPLTYTAPPLAGQTANVTVLCSTQGPVFGRNEPLGTSNEGTMLASIVGLAGLPLVGMVLMPGRSRRSRMLRIVGIFALVALMMVFQAACGGGSSGGGFGGAPKQISAGTAKGDYVITVTPSPAPVGTPPPPLTLRVQ